MSEKSDTGFEKSQFFRDSLSTVLTEAGLDLSTLVSNGCLCCDVGAGSEITALLPLKPKIFIASEPETDHWESEAIDKELKELQKKRGFELVRDEPEVVLQSLARKKIKLGLIVWLRVHPLKIKTDEFINFVEKTKPLLIKGGAVVISVGYSGFNKPALPGEVDSDKVEGGEAIFRAGSSIERLGFKINYSFATVEESQSAGGVFLIANHRYST
ncbi:hypothetical protein A3I57_01650 [Candidatus Beckwithbacteria bacterium RIFCSPLOWO2_02_FULL_47_23]|uniref:Methyltransferase type 11 domain-containing protein n=2 Tax=Candidatus Beckwithiibacteriota TaxID=1752726 RepID=A0A1F5E3H8_9BACT|nr:MAG: hypothetical protein A3E73_01205 [Candidatus Beckwithbacteria bacterium RIFCSPHIGHO2_12_FULL_47_17]OGD61860.1 MAG: hypothetical protein A3I57_01650 [Candidatus Beckwithbacteria bacterium RIFCSPLOWO2_02_FULL_47_23]